MVLDNAVVNHSNTIITIWGWALNRGLAVGGPAGVRNARAALNRCSSLSFFERRDATQALMD